MRKETTIYETLDEMRESVTMSHCFLGGQKELEEVCSQLQIIAADNGDELPKKFEIKVSEGNLLYKIKRFFSVMDLEVQKIMIGKKKEQKMIPIEVTLK